MPACALQHVLLCEKNMRALSTSRVYGICGCIGVSKLWISARLFCICTGGFNALVYFLPHSQVREYNVVLGFLPSIAYVSTKAAKFMILYGTQMYAKTNGIQLQSPVLPLDERQSSVPIAHKMKSNLPVKVPLAVLP